MYYQAMAIKRQWLTGSVGACPLIIKGGRMVKKKGLNPKDRDILIEALEEKMDYHWAKLHRTRGGLEALNYDFKKRRVNGKSNRYGK